MLYIGFHLVDQVPDKYPQLPILFRLPYTSTAALPSVGTSSDAVGYVTAQDIRRFARAHPRPRFQQATREMLFGPGLRERSSDLC